METEESERSVTPPPLPAEEPVASSGCKVCGAQPQEGFPIPLCSDCRTKLARRPIPIGIKVAGAIVGLLIIFALTRIPTSMAATVAFERGLAADKRGDFAAAEKAYQKCVAVFRNSDRVHGRLFVASFKAGRRSRVPETPNPCGSPSRGSHRSPGYSSCRLFASFTSRQSDDSFGWIYFTELASPSACRR